MSQAAQFDPEELRVRNHWLQHRPKMAAELTRQNQLTAAVKSATDQMKDSQADLVSRGMDYQQALEISRPIAYLPSEEDVPDLPGNPFLPLPETTE